jgi:MoaA/NifB/PqqE/SkfB family radical SAM enzyme
MDLVKKNNIEIKEITQLNMEVFGGCNLACPMCPQGIEDGREKDFKKSLNEGLFKKIIDEAIPLGLKYVNLSGSGEPLLNRKLEEFVKYLSSKNIISMIYTNGQLLDKKRFISLCESGISIIKVSCMGWDKESYKKWMSKDSFDIVRLNLRECLDVLKTKDYKTILQTNHLIQDYKDKDFQFKEYKKNWIDYLDIKAEIWMAHNWSGIYDKDEISRKNKKIKKIEKRSCGRPLNGVIEIRAGGIGKSKGAVVPCPNVLGHDSIAVLGHLDESSLLDVVNGKKYTELRKRHVEKKFDEIDYCKNCDHLIEYPDSLVWTNIEGREYGTSRISLLNYLD